VERRVKEVSEGKICLPKVRNEAVREVGGIWKRLARSGVRHCMYILSDEHGNMTVVAVYYDPVEDVLLLWLGFGHVHITVRDVMSTDLPPYVFISISGIAAMLPTSPPMIANPDVFYDYLTNLLNSLVLVKEVCWG